MTVKIFDFESIEARAQKPFAPGTAIISIGDNGNESPKLKYAPDYIIRLEFEDIAPDELDDEGRNPDHIFNDEQAREIAGFIYNVKDKTDTIICQCEYGQSRSAGLAAAIREHFHGDGIDIFADDRYYPNKLVFRKVLNALNELSK